MKKFKKLLALTCVAAMLVPSVAFASEQNGTSTPVTGGGSANVENDNSTDISYAKVVVPTVNEHSYDFTIDRDKLAPSYDPNGTYDDATVLFTKENTPAQIAVKTGVTNHEYTLMKAGKALDINGSGNTEAIAAAISSSALAEDLLNKTLAAATDAVGKYFVWVPTKTGDTYDGGGEFVEIVFVQRTEGEQTISPNYDKYLKLTIEETGNTVTAIELQKGALSGTDVWDGNIYKMAYAEIDGAAAVKDYGITYAEGAFSTVGAGLFIKDVDSTNDDAPVTQYVALDKTNAAAYVTYTAATQKYTGTSDEATVVNKSTSPIAVSIDVTVTAPGLTFNQTGVYAVQGTPETEGYVAADSAASVYFTVSDGSNTKAVDTKGKATAYYVLAGTNLETKTFQDTNKNSTGSHDYYKYEAPILVTDDPYASKSFTISATANSDAASTDAWAAYVKDLADAEKTEIVKPTIEVVYNWVTVELDDEAEFVYVDDEGNTYDAASGTDGWAEMGSATPVEFEPTDEFILNGSKTKVIFQVEGTSVTSAKVYKASDYANKSNPTAIQDVKSNVAISASGYASIDIEILDSICTEDCDYAFVLVVDGVTYTAKYPLAE